MPIPPRLSGLLLPLILAGAPASADLNTTQKAALAVFQYELGRGGSLAAMEKGNADLATRLITGPVPLDATELDGLWPYQLHAADATRLEPPLAVGMFPDRIRDLDATATPLNFARQLRRYVGSVAEDPRCPYLEAGHLTAADCALLADQMHAGYTGDPARWAVAIPKAARGLELLVARAARVLEGHLGTYLTAQHRANSWLQGEAPPPPPSLEALRIVRALDKLQAALEATPDPYRKLESMKDQLTALLKKP